MAAAKRLGSKAYKGVDADAVRGILGCSLHCLDEALCSPSEAIRAGAERWLRERPEEGAVPGAVGLCVRAARSAVKEHRRGLSTAPFGAGLGMGRIRRKDIEGAYARLEGPAQGERMERMLGRLGERDWEAVVKMRREMSRDGATRGTRLEALQDLSAALQESRKRVEEFVGFERSQAEKALERERTHPREGASESRETGADLEKEAVASPREEPMEAEALAFDAPLPSMEFEEAQDVRAPAPAILRKPELARAEPQGAEL